MLTNQYLSDVKERALTASYNKEKGDSWTRSHGCVVGYNNGKGVLITLPGGPRDLLGYPNDPVNEFAFSRHIAGSSPRTIINLVNEILRLKALVGE